MSRTAINVVGDLVTCLLAERWLGDDQAKPIDAAPETVVTDQGSIKELAEPGDRARLNYHVLTYRGLFPI